MTKCVYGIFLDPSLSATSLPWDRRSTTGATTRQYSTFCTPISLLSVSYTHCVLRGFLCSSRFSVICKVFVFSEGLCMVCVCVRACMFVCAHACVFLSSHVLSFRCSAFFEFLGFSYFPCSLL